MQHILAIGTTCNVEKNIFTGQSVMFDGVVNKTSECGIKVSVIDISAKHGNNRIFRVLDYVVILVVLFAKLLMNKFCLAYIITSQSKAGFYRDYLMISLCRLFNLKVVTHQYGGNYNQMLQVMNNSDMNRLKRMTDYISKIIVEGDYMKEQFSFYKEYKEKVVVVPNGLPIEGKNVCKSKVYDADQPFKLFYLSNLIYSKGYFDVLKAVDLLVNKYNRNVECVFAGKFMPAADDVYQGISNKEDFDRFIHEKNLAKFVKYFPGLYGNEKDEMFNEANVFLLPSYYINEGQPVSIIEAMAYGCVPIVTEYRHIPMMVSNQNGCFLPPRSPESICNSIIQLIDNPKFYHGKSVKCIEDYTNKFRFEIFVTKVLNIFNAVIEK